VAGNPSSQLRNWPEGRDPVNGRGRCFLILQGGRERGTAKNLSTTKKEEERGERYMVGAGGRSQIAEKGKRITMKKKKGTPSSKNSKETRWGRKPVTP